MANRNIPSDFYNTAFVRGLPGPYKFFWGWLQLNCDHAGIWEIDIDNARMRTGFFDLDIDKAQELFKLKILVLDCGEKWFLPEYPESQFKTKELNPQNTYHWGAIVILQKLRLMDNDFIVKNEQMQGACKPLYSSSKAAKVFNIKIKDLNIKENIEEVSIKEAPKKPTLKKLAKAEKPDEAPAVQPRPAGKTFSTPLSEAFKDFREMRVKKRAPLTERATSMIHTELTKLAGDNIELKIAILNQSTRNSWLDVFPLKEKKLNNPIQANNGAIDSVTFKG